MPSTHTLDDILGRTGDRPRVHVNGDGAVVAITYTAEQWEALDPRLKLERGMQRSVATRCRIRGLVSVDAFVVGEHSAAAPKPWSRAHRGADADTALAA